jgi:hypothetical protein
MVSGSKLFLFKLDPNKKTLLLGGPWCRDKPVNRKEQNIQSQNVQVWQCGKLYYEEYKKYI